MRNDASPGTPRVRARRRRTSVFSPSLALDFFHERRRLDAKNLRNLHEFKDVELSFARFELPDE